MRILKLVSSPCLLYLLSHLNASGCWIVRAFPFTVDLPFHYVYPIFLSAHFVFSGLCDTALRFDNAHIDCSTSDLNTSRNASNSHAIMHNLSNPSHRSHLRFRGSCTGTGEMSRMYRYVRYDCGHTRVFDNSVGEAGKYIWRDRGRGESVHRKLVRSPGKVVS